MQKIIDPRHRAGHVTSMNLKLENNEIWSFFRKVVNKDVSF